MMKWWREKLSSTWRNALGGAALCVVLGLIFFRWGNEIVLLSYDLLFLPGLHRSTPPDEVVVVYIDDRSYQHFGQTSVPTWDRNLHAQLVDRMTRDRARVVAFDIVFLEPGTQSANANFARAIRENGKVVLAASLDARTRGQILARSPKLPLSEFLDAAAGWGVTATWKEKDIARQYFLGNDIQPSMPWTAAKIAGAAITKVSNAREPDVWLNYYGPSRFLRWISYSEVTNQPPGFFQDKCIFVGAGSETTLKALEEADVFPTPHRRWGGELFPGVELGTTAFLNLLHNKGLREWSLPGQFALLVFTGFLAGALLALLRPARATGIACLGLLACAVGAAEAARHHIWFSWTVIALVQIPCALAWSIGGHYYRLKFQKDVLARTLEETTKLVEATKATARQKPAQMIPDHTLVKRVGKGAYGEVWLARNAVGVYHAAKIIQRRGFPADEPYEREFRGIQKFMPVSRTHPGFVHILHVGRNDEERYFFCVMEAGDDKTTGQRIDPETYSPKTLGTELEWRGRIIPEECLQLGLALTLALEHLHQSQLIHRDIKPSNIIYVNGAPKFADIGLVTDIRSAGHDVSFLGTEGYIAPEGPGTASADVYALGKVLYEAAMGKDRRLFPEVPTAVLEEPSEGLLRRLNEVIFKACEMAANERYQTAGEMHADLLALQNLFKQRPR
jgi:CHASE2 domain-containing sensor protein